MSAITVSVYNDTINARWDVCLEGRRLHSVRHSDGLSALRVACLRTVKVYRKPLDVATLRTYFRQAR